MPVFLLELIIWDGVRGGWEGEDDAKFYHHPTTKWSKMAYDVLHHPAYHVLHFLISVLLLLLALAETPAVGEERLSKEAKEILTSVSRF